MKLRHSRAKERHLQKERRKNKNDIVQPYDEKGKINRRFEKIYGKEFYRGKREEA